MGVVRWVVGGWWGGTRVVVGGARGGVKIKGAGQGREGKG